jgi:hypothetical protein
MFHLPPSPWRTSSWLRPWMIGLSALLLLAGIGAAVPAIRATFIDTGAVSTLTINGDVLPSGSGVKRLGNPSLPWWQVNSNSYYVPGGGAFDTMAGVNAGTMYLGNTNATGIVIGQNGIQTTLFGGLVPGVTNTLSLGTPSFLLNQVNSSFYYVPGGGAIDTESGGAAGTLHIGDVNATGIVLGKSGSTAALAGNVTVAGTLQGSAGTGTATGLVPITLYENTTVTPSVTSGETAGSTYPIPANTLSAVGNNVHISAGWTHAANTNSTTYKLYFNGAAFISATNATSGDTIFTDFYVVRTTAGYSWHSFTISGGAGLVGGHGTSTATFTSSIDTHISVTGPTANGDLSTNYLRVEYWP